MAHHSILPSQDLHSAALDNNTELLSVLLAVPGVDVNLQDNLGRTPLHQAADVDIGYTVALNLIDRGSEINGRDDDGKTPLLLATLQNNRGLLERLL